MRSRHQLDYTNVNDEEEDSLENGDAATTLPTRAELDTCVCVWTQSYSASTIHLPVLYARITCVQLAGPNHTPTVVHGGWCTVEHSPRNKAQSAGYYCGFRALDYFVSI